MYGREIILRLFLFRNFYEEKEHLFDKFLQHLTTNHFRWRSLFLLSVHLQVKQYKLYIYTWYLAEMRNSATFSRVNSRSTRGTGEKGQEESKKGYRARRKGLTWQFRHVSMPLGDVHGMWSRQPSLLSPPFAPLSLPNTRMHPYKPANSPILVVPASSSSILTSLYRSGHVSLGAGNDPPGLRVDCGRSLSTLVINTNCSIQTFKMCLTFLWHVIPSLSRSLF